VLLEKLFKPRRMSAVDIRPQPVEPLLHYASRNGNRFVHLGTSQQDGEVLKQIVLGALADELDLVVDDASHTYGHFILDFHFMPEAFQQCQMSSKLPCRLP
jgi:hypothetical protein